MLFSVSCDHTQKNCKFFKKGLFFFYFWPPFFWIKKPRSYEKCERSVPVRQDKLSQYSTSCDGLSPLDTHIYKHTHTTSVEWKKPEDQFEGWSKVLGGETPCEPFVPVLGPDNNQGWAGHRLFLTHCPKIMEKNESNRCFDESHRHHSNPTVQRIQRIQRIWLFTQTQMSFGSDCTPFGFRYDPNKTVLGWCWILTLLQENRYNLMRFLLNTLYRVFYFCLQQAAARVSLFFADHYGSNISNIKNIRI